MKFFAKLLLVVTTLSFTAPWSLRAQAPRQPEPKKVGTTGKIRGIQRNVFQVVGEDGDQWLVQPPRNPRQVTYYASADPSWLKAGMFVRFKGEFDRQGKAVSEITELEVFTPPAATREGRWPKQNPQRPAEDDPNRIGVFPVIAATTANLFTDPGDQKKAVESRAFRIVGQLTGTRGNAIAVNAGANVTAPLSDDVQISVGISDLRFAKAGDEITVEGWQVPGQFNQMVANFMRIRAAETLGTRPAAEAATPE